ncbi:uncharacterized protein FIBRA_03296 [Fibroporia radiculosa]|uniref:alcohol dehydrogenase n=1 Tax=Fibroporia radiculosa TaxID=599839 RepID=J4HVX0_9APHY|nr:uncharacterized protein FIBRA_03296 [Fibroporia radiculosa]CCM01247.1 predicted protein [Fibroporia radiculosa]
MASQLGLQNETIPLTTRAAVTTALGMRTELSSDWPVKNPSALAPGECIVKIEYTGVCHSDLHLMLGDWLEQPLLPSVGGHEGVGRVVAIGAHTADRGVKIGDRVGIKHTIGTCMRCDMCLRGFDQHCPDRVVSGRDVDGTFAEYMVAFVDQLIPIPAALSSVAAAPILCAGVTVYDALKKLDAPTGSWLVISGGGGGLGHLGIQYAISRGLRVAAIDTGADKRTLCLSLGAEAFIDYAESTDVPADVRAATDPLGVHAALVTTTSSLSYVQAAKYVRRQGTILCVGVPPTLTDFPIGLVVDRGIKLIASQTGGRLAVQEALALAARGKYGLQPVSFRPDESSLDAMHVIG